MTYTCFKCQKPFEKNLQKGHGVMLEKTCVDCRGAAPRQSLRPMRSAQKPKGGKF